MSTFTKNENSYEFNVLILFFVSSCSCISYSNLSVSTYTFCAMAVMNITQ